MVYSWIAAATLAALGVSAWLLLVAGIAAFSILFVMAVNLKGKTDR